MANLSSYKQYYYPADATAEAWDIKTGKMAYLPAGKVAGTGYFPAMMEFNGSTGYYSAAPSVSGNKMTVVMRFKIASLASTQRLFNISPISPATTRLAIFTYANNDVESPGSLRFFVRNTSNVIVCYLSTVAALADNTEHTVFFEYDGDVGTAVLIVDGVSDIDTGHTNHVLTTGTISTGATQTQLGATATPADYVDGSIGFFGYRDTGGLLWSDFMQTDGTPKPLDESTWTEWGSQPLFWHEAGKMDENKGSAGAMTKNGSITLASAIS